MERATGMMRQFLKTERPSHAKQSVPALAESGGLESCRWSWEASSV